MVIKIYSDYIQNKSYMSATSTNTELKSASIFDSQLRQINNEKSQTVSQIQQFNKQKQPVEKKIETASNAVKTAQNNLAASKDNFERAKAHLEAVQNIFPEIKTNEADGSKYEDTTARDTAIAEAEAAVQAAQSDFNTAQAEFEKAQAEKEQAEAEANDIEAQINGYDAALSDLENEENYIIEEKAAAEEAEQEAQEKSNNKENPFTVDNVEKETVTEVTLEETTVLTDTIQDLFSDDKTERESAEKFIKELAAKEYDNSTDPKVALYKDILMDAYNMINNSESIADSNESNDKYTANFQEESAINARDNNLVVDHILTMDELNQINISDALHSQTSYAELSKMLNDTNGVAPEVSNAISLALQELEHSFDIGFNWEYRYDQNDSSGANRGEMLKYGGAEGDPWCCSFVSYLYGEAQDIDFKATFPNNYTKISVAALRQNADSKECYSRIHHYDENGNSVDQNGQYNPVAGDLIVFGNNGASHIGMVIGNDENYVYTIEGNADDAVRAKKYAKPGTSDYEASQRKYDDISGYIRMNDVYGGTGTPIALTYLPEEAFELAMKHEGTI